MKYTHNAMKFGTQSRSSLLNINMIFETGYLDQNSKTWEDLVSKLQCAPIFMKFGTQCKSNMLIMNIVLGTDDLNPKLQILVNLVPRLKFALIFIKFGTHNKSNMLVMNAIPAIGSQLLQAQNDYIDCKIRLTARTWLIALTPR